MAAACSNTWACEVLYPARATTWAGEQPVRAAGEDIDSRTDLKKERLKGKGERVAVVYLQLMVEASLQGGGGAPPPAPPAPRPSPCCFLLTGYFS